MILSKAATAAFYGLDVGRPQGWGWLAEHFGAMFQKWAREILRHLTAGLKAWRVSAIAGGTRSYPRLCRAARSRRRPKARRHKALGPALIALTPEADAQVEALEQFHIDRHRPEAMRNLDHALADASLVILDTPKRGTDAPGPYPDLAASGLLWLERGRYRIAYDPALPVVAGIFFETDDIPNRFYSDV